MSNTEWDTKTVVGYKAKKEKVTRNTSDLNGEWSVTLRTQGLFADPLLLYICVAVSKMSCLLLSVSDVYVRRGEQAPSFRRIRKLPLVGTRLIVVCSDIYSLQFRI